MTDRADQPPQPRLKITRTEFRSPQDARRKDALWPPSDEAAPCSAKVDTYENVTHSSAVIFWP